jgi:hypothetical protein
MRGLVNIAMGKSDNHRLEVVATSRAGSGNTVWHASETSVGMIAVGAACGLAWAASCAAGWSRSLGTNRLSAGSVLSR